MKKFPLLCVLLLLLFLLASTASVYFTCSALQPEEGDGAAGALGAGLRMAFSLVFVTFAAAIELIASATSLLGLLLARREGARKRWVALFAVFIPLPLLVSALSYLLILL